MNKRSLTYLTVIISILLLAACGGREERAEGETWLGQPTDTAANATQPEVASGATAIVLLQDGTLAAPNESLSPGPVVFTIENRGTELHGLFIEGPGVQRAADRNIAAGETTTMDAVLQEGSYTLYCPVTNHRENGEQMTVTVAR